MLSQSIRRNELLRCVRSILEFIEELSAKDYHSQSIVELLDAYRLTLNSLYGWLQYIKPSDLIPKHSNEIHNILVNGISTSLRYIQRSQTKYTPWSMLTLLEELVGKIYEDQRIVIRPKWRWHYQIATKPMNIKLSELLAYMCANDPTIIDECNKLEMMRKIRFVSFPIMEVDNYLAHILFFHEIGHLIQEEMFDNIIPKKLSEMMYDKNRKDDNDDMNARQITVYINMLLQEIIPDVVAYLLVGPAYFIGLFTAQNYSLVNGSDKLPTKQECSDIIKRSSLPTYPHPPLALRLTYLYDYYYKRDIKEKYQGCYYRLKPFSDCNDYTHKETIARYSSTEPNIDIAYRIFIAIMEAVKPDIKKRLDGLVYSGASRTDIEYLLNKLRHDIPPVELKNGNVAEIGDVFLAAFFYVYFEIIRKEKNPVSYCEKMETMNKLIKFTFNGIRYKDMYNACLSR